MPRTASRLAALALILTACQTHRIGDLSIVANRNVPMDPAVLQTGLRGEDCAFDSFGVPSLEEAIDRAQRQVPEANALTNAKVELRVELYVLLTRRCFIVTGDAVQIPGTK